MEADDSDFFLKFEESLEKKRVDVSISCETSRPVTRLFNRCSNGQSVTRSSAVNGTVFYEKYRICGRDWENVYVT